MLKQRLFSSAVGICLFSVTLYFARSLFFDIVVATVAMIAITELLSAVLAEKEHVTLRVVCFICGIVVSLSGVLGVKICATALFLGIVLLSYYAINQRHKLSMEKIFFLFSASAGLAFSLSRLVAIRDMFWFDSKLCLFGVLLAAASAWVTDTGSYIVGCSMGKRPLKFEDVSPKKTIEGIVGGMVISFLVGLIICSIFMVLNPSITIKWGTMIFILPLASGLAVLGDLVASLLKRQTGIKDFGSIMPGHGGILDRIDSLVFVMPFFYMVFDVFKVIKI